MHDLLPMNFDEVLRDVVAKESREEGALKSLAFGMGGT